MRTNTSRGSADPDERGNDVSKSRPGSKVRGYENAYTATPFASEQPTEIFINTLISDI